VLRWFWPSFLRRNSASLRADQTVVLDAPVSLELERCLLEECGGVEVAVLDDQFVIGGLSQSHNLAIWMNDARTGHQITSVSGTCLGHTGHSASVLVGAHLHAQMIVVYAGLRSLVAGQRV